MKYVIASVLAAGFVTSAMAETINVTPGEWKVSIDISGEMNMGGQITPLPPETETETECWRTDEETTLSADLLKVEGCTISNSVTSANAISFDMTCISDGLEMDGNAKIVTNLERDMFSGTMFLVSEFSGAAIDVRGTMMGARMRSCQ